MAIARPGDHLFERARAVPVIEVVQRYFPSMNLRRSGDRLVGNCPFPDHRDDTPSFTLYPSNNSFYCFGCGRGGSVIDLVAAIDEASPLDAARRIARDFLGEGGEDFPLPSTKSLPGAGSLAPVERRDRVYRSLLSVLSLREEHKADLLRRGLDEKAIHGNGYKSVPQDARLRWKITRWLTSQGLSLDGVPGFYTRSGKHGLYWDFISPPGYFIPVKDPRGLVQALKIRTGGDGGKYIWFSSAREPNGTPSGAPPHFEPGCGECVWVTEGPLKAQVAGYLSGEPFLGVGGVTAWKSVLDALKDIGAGRVRVAFDADQQANPNVKEQVAKLLDALKGQGFTVENVTWPPKIRGEDCKGIDDLLYLVHKKSWSVTLIVNGVPVTVRRTTTTEIIIGK